MYEKEILKNLLINSGIDNKIDHRVTPNKHPNMKILERALKSNNINYVYFVWTDTLAVTQVDFGEHTSLSHTLMMPSQEGISIIMVVNTNEEMEEVMEHMCESLDAIIPEEISYNILGIV